MSQSILEDAIQPVVKGLLAVRGLDLPPEKTVITHIQDGFTFFGQTFRKYGRVLHIAGLQPGPDQVNRLTPLRTVLQASQFYALKGAFGP